MKRQLFLMLTLMLLVAGAWVQGATINVPADYSTIQAAINAATAEDVIVVSAGTYPENLVINKALTLNGANANVTCGSRGSESVIAPASGLPVSITADGVTLNGFEITAPGYQNAIVCGNTSNLNIKYNNIHHIGTTVTGTNVHAINYTVANAASTSTVSITHNCIDYVSGSSLTGYSAAAIGILQSTSTGDLTNLVIENNTISNVHVNTGTWPTGKLAYGLIINVGGSASYLTTGKVVNATIRYNEISNLSGFISTAIGLEGNTENAYVTYNTVSLLSGTKVADRSGGGYDLNALKFESNRYVSTCTVANNSFMTNTFTHGDPDGVGYAVSNYVPSGLAYTGGTTGAATVTCNWLGTANYSEIQDNVDMGGRVFTKDNCSLVYIPYLTDGTDTDPALGFQPIAGACDNGYPVQVYNGATFVSGHATIQAAINAASAGNIIEVAAGTYDYESEGQPVPDGLIKVNKALTIRAAAGARPVIDGSDFNGVFKIWGTTFTGQVVIQGFEIFGNATTSIAITGAMNDNVSVIIHDNWFHGMNGGIDFWGNSTNGNPYLEGYEITNNKFYDLVAYGTDQGFGIMLEDPANWINAGNDYAAVVEDNEFYNIADGTGGNLGVGIVLPRANSIDEAANVYMAGNTFYDVTIGIAVLDGDVTPTLIEENSFASSLTFGVFASDIDFGPVNATCNYWGTMDPAIIATKISGAVASDPFNNYMLDDCSGHFPFTNDNTGIGYLNMGDAIASAEDGDHISINNPGNSPGITVNKPGKKIYINNESGGEFIFEGASPALTVTAGEVVVENGITFTTATNDPTILVNGGDLTIRNCSIEASTGFDNAGIRITSGTLDAGLSSVDPGHNTFIYNSNGDKAIDNQTALVCDAIGNYWGSILYTDFIPNRIFGPVNFDPWCNSYFTECGYSLLTPGPITYASKLIRPAGTVVVPVTVKDFDNVMSVSLKLGYESGLTYVGIAPGPAPVPQTDWVFSHDGVNNKISITYQATEGFSLDDDVVLLNITFIYDGLDTRDLTWIEESPNGTDLEYTNSVIQAPYYDIPNSTYYLPGYVTNGTLTFTREYPGIPTGNTEERIYAVITPDNGPYTYAWTGPNSYSSTTNPAVLVPGDYGDYTVVVTDGDGATIAGTYYYGPVHNINTYIDYATIQEAIDATPTLNTHAITVDDITFNLASSINVHKSVSITGNLTTPANVVVNAPTSGNDRDVFQVVTDDVSIQGFTIQGAKDVGLNVLSGTNSGITVGGDRMILATKPAGAIEFTFSSGGTPWWGKSVSGTYIANNIIQDNSFGIFLFHAVGVEIINNDIIQNTQDVNTWSGKGIAIYTSKDMSDNALAIGGTALPNTYNITISENFICNNELFGIELNHAEAWHGGVGGPYNVDVKILDNEICNNGGPLDALGIPVDAARGISANGNETNVTVTGNTIYGHASSVGTRFHNGNGGIRINNSFNWTIQDNEVYNNMRGIYAFGTSTGITINAGTEGANIIRDNAQAIVMANGTTGLVEENQIFDNNVTTWLVSNSISPFGVLNLGTSLLDASPNWWGDASGPYCDPYNTCGLGNAVSNNVDFMPWYKDEGMTISTNANGDLLVNNTVQGTYYCKIQDAVDDANSSDVIVVAAGTFPEQVTIPISLTLTGAGAANTIIQIPATGRTTIPNTTYSTTNGFDYVVAAYGTPASPIDVKIEGFTIDANGQDATDPATQNLVGVFFADVSGTTAGLSQCTVQNFGTYYTSWPRGNAGVWVLGESDLTIGGALPADGNNISAYTTSGIVVNGYSTYYPDVLVSNNTVTGPNSLVNVVGHGVQLGFGALGEISDNVISNHIGTSGSLGIYLYQPGTGCIVSGNSISNCYSGINLYQAQNATVTDNSLTGLAFSGIALGASSGNTVDDNTITMTGTATHEAILLANNSGNNFLGSDGKPNVITMPTASTLELGAPYLPFGIYLSGIGANDNTIQYNIIDGTGAMIQVDGNTGITTISNNILGNTTAPSFRGIQFNGGNAVISNNILTNTVRPMEFWGASDLDINNNTINGAAYDGINLGSASGTKNISLNTISNINSSSGNLSAINGRADADNLVINCNTITTSDIGIFIESGNTGSSITNNTITNGDWSGITSYGPLLTVTGNTIDNCWRGIEMGNALTAHNNRFTNNAYGSVIFMADHAYDVSDNWWNSIDGPSVWLNGVNVASYNQAGQVEYIQANANGNFVVAPWLTSGTDSDEATCGFQPAAGTSFAPVYANADGSATETEQYHSIQSANDGTSLAYVIAKAGTFSENVTIDNSIILNGANVGVPGTDPGRSAESIISAGAGLAVYVSVDNVTIDGFEIKHTTIASLNDMGIQLDLSDGSTIQNNYLHMNSVGLMLLDAGSNEVLDNLFDVNAVGIYFEGTRDGLGTESLYPETLNGPFYSLSLNNVLTGNTVQNSILMSGQGGQGIYLDAVCEDNTFTNNTVTGSEGPGYYAWKASNNTLSANTIQSNASEGMYLFGSSGNTITQNTLSGNAMGIRLQSGALSSTTNTLSFNFINANDVGIKLEDDFSGNNYIGFVSGNTIEENNISGNTTYGLQVLDVEPGTIINANCNWWGFASLDDISGLIDGVVDYIPWLIDGTDNEPGTAGFQPVPGTCDGNPIITGTLKYYNLAMDQMNGVELELQGGTTPYPTTTVTNGVYTFDANNIDLGTYDIVVTSNPKAPGSINATDAALANYWGVTHSYVIEYVRFLAGDVADLDYAINSTDASRIQLYFVNPTVNTFDRSAWSYWKANEYVVTNTNYGNIISVTVSDANITQNLFGQVTGDFNMSYQWNLFKAGAANVALTYDDSRLVDAGAETILPVRMVNAAEVGAISLVFNYPSDLMEVTDVTMKDNSGRLDWAVVGNELRIGWNAPNAITVEAGEELLVIHLKTSESFTSGSTIRLEITPDPVNELADAWLTTIPDVELSIDMIEFSAFGVDDPNRTEALALKAYPNPFNHYTMLRYELPTAGHVSLVVSNMYGMNVATLVDDLQTAGSHSLKLDALNLSPGVYLATITLDSREKDLIQTIKIILNR